MLNLGCVASSKNVPKYFFFFFLIVYFSKQFLELMLLLFRLLLCQMFHNWPFMSTPILEALQITENSLLEKVRLFSWMFSSLMIRYRTCNFPWGWPESWPTIYCNYAGYVMFPLPQQPIMLASDPHFSSAPEYTESKVLLTVHASMFFVLT